MLWQAVVLLPFIEEARLLDAVAPLEKTLTPEEAARNGRRIDQLYVSTAHPLAPEAFEVLFAAFESDVQEQKNRHVLTTKQSKPPSK